MKKAISWKLNRVVSIETRRGVFVLAQMLKEPFLRFYKAFREDENWGKVDAGSFETLAVNAVTRQFLKFSKITIAKEATPDTTRSDSKLWINLKNGSRKVKVWEGTENESAFVVLGAAPGGSLVEKDLWWSPTPSNPTRPHPSGVVDAVLREDIELDDDVLIDQYELTSLAVYPAMNERLYLCSKAGKNVDPAKEIGFGRKLPLSYKVYVEILVAGSNRVEANRILDTYFR